MNQFHGQGPLLTLGRALADIAERVESAVRRACHLDRAPTVIWIRQANNTYVGVMADDGRRSRSRASSDSVRRGADRHAFTVTERNSPTQYR